MKWKKRQKGGKKVNKLRLFMFYLVVSSEVIATSGAAMLAQSAFGAAAGESADGGGLRAAKLEECRALLMEDYYQVADARTGDDLDEGGGWRKLTTHPVADARVEDDLDEGGGRRKLTTYPVSDHEAFFNKISSGSCDTYCTQGNALMSNGDEVVAAEGVYQCGTCNGNHVMYVISDLNGVIRCQNDELQCKLDGQGSRGVMSVGDTGGGTLSLRGFHIHRGSAETGGGIIISIGIVNLSIMKFTECQAFMGKGGAIDARSGTINLYAVEFSGNSADQGDDISADGYSSTLTAAVTIHSNCPDGYDGSPTVGAALDTYMDSGTITGPTNSYAKGTCPSCPAGQAGNGPSSCASCPGGGRTDAGGTICVDCPPGTYGTTPISDQCLPCTGSTFTSSINQLSCSSCPSGTWASTDNTGCTSSITCPIGQGQAAVGGTCEVCPSGRYSDVDDDSQCSFCPAGKHNPSTGSTSSACVDCPVGRYSVEYAALSECTACVAGKYNKNTASTLASSCVNCAMGTYNTNVGSGAASDCAFCPTGKINPDTVGASSASACSVDCAAGEGASSDSTSCESCTAGTYGPATGLGCFQCGRGKYSDAVGATTETQCANCPVGKSSPAEGVPSYCENCPAGSYAPGEGYAMCVICPPFSSPTSDQMGCETSEGYYSDDGAELSVAVPPGVKKTVPGMTIETLDLEEGFWRTSSSSIEILSCLNEEHCKGGNNTADLCSEGYTGPLCAVCASGFAATGNGELLVCNECTGASIFTVLGVLAVVFVLITAILIFFFKGTSERTPPPFKTRSSSVSEKYENFSSRLSKIEPIVKIITAYFQVAGGLSFVYGLKFPKFFSTVTNWFGGIFSLNFIAFMPLGCSAPVNHYNSLLVYTGLPILLGIVLIASSKLASKPELRNKIFEVFLTMTFILLPSVSVKIFSTFACKDFDDGKSFLKVDYSIACDDGPEYWFYWTYAMAMIAVYPVGIPLMYFILVYRKRDLLECGQGHLEESMSDNAALREALKIRAKNEEENETLKSLRFLYGAYEPKYWWFEIFETLRKLALTGFLVFLAPGTAAQIAISMLMGLATLRVQSGTKPYIEAVNDKFAEVAMWQLFLTMFAALCLKVNLDDESLQDQGYFDMTLTLIQFLPLILVLLQDALTIQDQGNDAKDEAISLSQDAVEVGVRGARAITESVDTAITTFKTGAVLGGGSEIEMKSKTNKDQVRGENPAVQLNSKNNEGGGLLGGGRKKVGDDSNI